MSLLHKVKARYISYQTDSDESGKILDLDQWGAAHCESIWVLYREGLSNNLYLKPSKSNSFHIWKGSINVSCFTTAAKLL